MSGAKRNVQIYIEMLVLLLSPNCVDGCGHWNKMKMYFEQALFEKENPVSLVKIYDYNATREAIERADGKCINIYKLVRNDVSVNDWGKKNIKKKHRNPDVHEDFQWPGHKDVGHTFRHVEATAPAGKSVYVDQHTAISCTMQILNSPEGQAALRDLQGQNNALYDNTTLRVTATIEGTWYGKAAVGGESRRILEARCEITKLGDSLWVHSSYPRTFYNSVAELAKKFGG